MLFRSLTPRINFPKVVLPLCHESSESSIFLLPQVKGALGVEGWGSWAIGEVEIVCKLLTTCAQKRLERKEKSTTQTKSFPYL